MSHQMAGVIAQSDRVGWRLTLEQTMVSLAWSLVRVDGPLDDPRHQVWAGRIDDPSALASLAGSLVPSGSDIWDSPLADPAAEVAAAHKLGSGLLPRPLRDGLAADEARHTLTVSARGWPATVPWDALLLNDTGTRLIERARVLTEPHPLASSQSPGDEEGGEVAAPVGDPRRDDPSDPADGLAIIDPGPLISDDPATAPLYPAGLPPELASFSQTADVVLPGTGVIGPEELSEVLRSRRWRRGGSRRSWARTW